LWRLRGLGDKPLPLFAAAEAQGTEPAVALVPLSDGREVVEDYRAVQLSLRAHPLVFLRETLERRGVTPTAGLLRRKDGDKVRIAGLVLVRQRPGKGNVTFITLEDESGVANAIVWERIFEAHRRIVLAGAMIEIEGRLQREGQVMHIVADRIADLTDLLGEVGAMHFPHRPGPADAAKHGGRDPREQPRIRIRSRDFH
jgi:error-prone DNA polymerase